MKFFGLKTHLLQTNCDLIKELRRTLDNNKERLAEGDIIVISSKVVARAEGRVVDLSTVIPSRRARRIRSTRYGHGREDPRVIELILREADVVIPGKMLLTIKDGMLIPEAGIDLSNAPEGYAILWPKDSLRSAYMLWQNLCTTYGLKKLGVIICDSHCQPLRWGTTGLALAWVGFDGIEDARGTKDIYGKKLEVTKKAVADNFASAALILMGEAREKIPFVVARGAPVKFTKKMPKRSEMIVPPSECIFSGIYKNIAALRLQ